MRMHLYPREFAFVYTQKCKTQFRTCVCVSLRACVSVRAFACVSSHGFN